MLGYGRQTIDQADIDAVVAVLRGEYLTQGPAVERFEAALAERVSAKYAVAVANGTAALHVAALAAGARPGRRGVTSTLTFVASANCLLFCGAEADLLDVDADTLCMSPAALGEYLRDAAEADMIVTVDFAGLAGGSDELRRLAGGRVVIEDGCHALGGSYANGRPVGCGDFADMTVFSFHPVKLITTAEGGAVVTNDPDLARRLRLLRSHGIEREAKRLLDPAQAGDPPAPWYYEQQLLGFNYRLSDMQAALGMAQLSRLDGFLSRRREIAAFYDAAFASLKSLAVPQSAAEMRGRSGLHLYVIDVDWAALGTDRRSAMMRLRERGIGTQVHYIPVHRQPFHARRLKAGNAAFPVAEKYYEGCLSLPLFPSMTDEDAENVVSSVRDILGV